MTFIQNMVEYYDELYPVSDELKRFYISLSKFYKFPPKFLQIACGTGSFEFELAKQGYDVTGTEVFQPFLESALLKRRSQLLSIRFFKLSTLEMINFLGKKFYNVISCMQNRIVFIHDEDMLQKFFFDCRELLSEDGRLVLHLFNYEFFKKNITVKPPIKSSIRAKLYTEILFPQQDRTLLNQELETGSGRIIPIIKEEPVYPLTKEKILKFAKKANFTHFEFYSSFHKDSFTKDSKELICVLK